MTVGNAKALQRRRQLVSIELRIVPRSWDRPHVDDMLDAVSFQQMYELFDCPSGMTNGKDGERYHVSSLARGAHAVLCRRWQSTVRMTMRTLLFRRSATAL